MKTWIVALIGIIGKWFLDVFSGPRSKFRVRLEVKSEAVIADERKHLEELKHEVRRLEQEMAKLSPQCTAAIKAANPDRILELNDERNELHSQWSAARQRLFDYERYLDSGR